jgi:hypothetical protein
MFDGGLIIVVGVALIAWSKWLTVYMRSLKAAARSTHAREEIVLLESILHGPGVSWMTRILPLLGVVVVLYGVIVVVANA